MSSRKKSARRRPAKKAAKKRPAKKAAKKRGAKKAAKKRGAKKAARKRGAKRTAKRKASRKPSERSSIPQEPAAEWVRPGDLEPWSENPRAGQDAVVLRLVESIPVVGFGAPLVARRSDRRVVAGHARLEAALQLELEHVPVRFMDLTDDQAAAMTLLDNRVGELAQWDGPGVAQIVEALPQDLAELMAWTDDDLEELARVEEQAAPRAPKPRNPALYRIQLTPAQEADWAPLWARYQEAYPDASAGDLVAFLCRQHGDASL